MSTQGERSTFAIRLLGGAAVCDRNGPMLGRIAQPRPVAVLALLAAAKDHGAPRDRLTGVLWSDESEPRARHHLSDTLYIIRSTLGADALRTTRQVVHLNPAVIECDACEFIRLVSEGRFADALPLYSGPFLDGFYVDGAPAFERWRDDEQARLAQMYLTCLESVAVDMQAAGRWQDAVGVWEKALRHDPYNSRIAVALAEALARCGDGGNGLQILREHASLLERELGVSPDPAVIALMTNGGWEQFMAKCAPPSAAVTNGVYGSGEGASTKLEEGREAQEAQEAPPTELATPRDQPQRAWTRITAAMGSIVATLLLSWWLLPIGRAALPSYTIAVVPFAAETAEWASWSNGLAEAIAWKLDGAGPVRATEPSRVLAAAGPGLDRLELGATVRRMGARFAVSGGLFSAGADSLRVNAWLVDGVTNEILREFDVVVSRESVVSAGDSVAVGVLSTLARTRGLGRVKFRSLGSRDSRAVRDFLSGEWCMRRLQLDSAIEFFQEAIARDTTFALAYSRLARTLRRRAWSAEGIEQFSRLQLAAGALNRGLAHRESLLLLIDSLDGVLWTVPRNEVYLHKDLLARYEWTLTTARQAYPMDQEVWFRQAEALIHWSPQIPGTHQEIYRAITRVLSLDSTWVRGYEYAIRYVSLAAGGPEETRRLIEAYRRHAPDVSGNSAQQTLGMQLLERLVSSDPSAYVRYRDSLERHLDPNVYRSALFYVHGATVWTADSTEFTLDVIRRIDEMGHQGAQLWVAGRLLYHGRAEQARVFMKERGFFDGHPMLLLPDLTYFGAIAAPEGMVEDARSRVSFDELRWLGLMQGLFAEIGDTAALRRAAALWDSSMTVPDSSLGRIVATAKDYYREAAQGREATAAGPAAVPVLLLRVVHDGQDPDGARAVARCRAGVPRLRFEQSPVRRVRGRRAGASAVGADAREAQPCGRGIGRVHVRRRGLAERRSGPASVLVGCPGGSRSPSNRPEDHRPIAVGYGLVLTPHTPRLRTSASPSASPIRSVVSDER
jgi:DNA-binding SARP family transcriptional activator